MGSVTLIMFAFAYWLAFYLISRNSHPRLRLTGAGLLAYAIVLGLGFTSTGEVWERINWALRLLPPLLWSGAILHIDDRIRLNRGLLPKIWKWILLPFTLLIGIGFVIGFNFIIDNWTWLSILIGLSPAIFTLILLQDLLTLLRPRQATGILLAATLFFTLGEGFLILPNNWFTAEWMLPAIGLDLLFLGFAIAWFDAFDEGETLLFDLLRSFAVTAFTVLIFAGQIGFIIAIHTGLTSLMRILLVSTITTAILLSVFADPLQSLVDKFVFLRAPSLQSTRAQLRTESALLPRMSGSDDLANLDDDKRTRITRGALSNFGNLPKLATSPLTKLPLIEERLRARNAVDNTLERATELKILLTESISRLKPASQKGFDSSEEWRYYNALYFPYVAGLRPYSRRQERDLAPEEQEALNWLQAYVPERTLYNWQNAGAKLVANDLWELNFPKIKVSLRRGHSPTKQSPIKSERPTRPR